MLSGYTDLSLAVECTNIQNRKETACIVHLVDERTSDRGMDTAALTEVTAPI